MVDHEIITVTPEAIISAKDATLAFIKNTVAQIPSLSPKNQKIAVRETGKALDYLANLTDAATAAIGVGDDTIKKLNADLDEAMREYDLLRRALKELDKRNPLVKEAATNLAQDIAEDLALRTSKRERELRQLITAEVYDKARETLIEVAVDYLHFMLKVDMLDARRFMQIIMDGDTTDIEPSELKYLGRVIEKTVAGAQCKEAVS